MHETAKELLQHAVGILDRNFRTAFHAWVSSVEERFTAHEEQMAAQPEAETAAPAKDKAAKDAAESAAEADTSVKKKG